LRGGGSGQAESTFIAGAKEILKPAPLNPAVREPAVKIKSSSIAAWTDRDEDGVGFGKPSSDRPIRGLRCQE
jgi:hypothetical protein